MENPAVTQLPEVDALPDGFVDSSREPLGPGTPIPEKEKPLRGDCSIDRQSEPDDQAHELVKKAIHNESDPLCHNREEKTQKVRSFPVALSESESFDDSLDLVGENSAGHGTVTRNLDSEESEKVSGCNEVEAQDQGKFQIPESIEGSLDVQEEQTKEIPSSDGDDNTKGKKIATSETKRKNVKRRFKSEKEFLEFTLRYQQVLAERDAALAVRDKLESLCRELQRQNKMLMDECKRVSTEGQNLRLDLSTKFQDTIKEVSNKLEQQRDESLNQLKENETLKIKLKQLADQYVLSQEHHEQELKQKSLELQIADLKIKQHEEKLAQEQSQMKGYAEQVSQLLATEKNLRLQLTADGEKFQEFQAALLKSNEVFETFKQEIEKMAKSIKDLKKENTFLKSKCEKSDYTLIELVEERERMKKQVEKLKNQKEKLESLCRSLQAERKQNLTVSNSSDSASG